MSTGPTYLDVHSAQNTVWSEVESSLFAAKRLPIIARASTDGHKQPADADPARPSRHTWQQSQSPLPPPTVIARVEK